MCPSVIIFSLELEQDELSFLKLLSKADTLIKTFVNVSTKVK